MFMFLLPKLFIHIWWGLVIKVLLIFFNKKKIRKICAELNVIQWNNEFSKFDALMAMIDLLFKIYSHNKPNLVRDPDFINFLSASTHFGWEFSFQLNIICTHLYFVHNIFRFIRILFSNWLPSRSRTRSRTRSSWTNKWKSK